MHNHKIKLHTFTGTGETQAVAAESATRKLEAWYQEQGVLFFYDGDSVFQFSTAAFMRSELFVFIITAFETRYT